MASSSTKRWLLGALAVAVAVPLVWFFGRPQPPAVDEPLPGGMRYVRVVRSSPRQIVHEVVVPLDVKRRIVVTPGDPQAERALRAQTTSDFARRHEVDVAINGDFFTPWHSRGPWDYYPHAGDLVDVRGVAVSDGVAYGAEVGEPGATLYFPCDGGATTQRPASLCHAISGRALLIDGEAVYARSWAARRRHPRTAVCLDAAGNSLILVVVDGRQPGYSVGMTLAELSAQLLEFGCHAAINLDGGGSSSLVVRRGGAPAIVSMPIHTRVPGWERPIANHLGIGGPASGG
jgi:Phosphodiester glycosidase